ncbi:hypothetical protein JHK82_018239 [Glycine max]|nr:hypothetical protein JHK85_018665 [Glycine max]KAG5142544.1 hypothetical protein JHK82_018239 [Glycine max]
MKVRLQEGEEKHDLVMSCKIDSSTEVPETIGPTTKVHQSEMVAFRIGRQLLHKKFIKGQITRHCLANYGVLRYNKTKALAGNWLCNYGAHNYASYEVARKDTKEGRIALGLEVSKSKARNENRMVALGEQEEPGHFERKRGNELSERKTK